MSEEEAFVAFAFFVSAVIAIKIIASAALRMQEAKVRATTAPSIDRELAARMERMEQAIDSIAVEVERISENQRFTTKLLSEREAAHRLSS